MTQSDAPVRFWGAVWKNDEPVVEVIDFVRGSGGWPNQGPDFRWWLTVDLGFSKRRKDGTVIWLKSEHTDGICEPGAPCHKCREKAPAYWFRWARKEKERLWYTADQACWDAHHMSDFRAFGASTQHSDEAAAHAAARKQHLPWVFSINGNGGDRQWFKVASNEE